MRALPALAVAALLAGCLGADSPPPAGDDLAFLPAVALPLGSGDGAYGFEPSVTADGTGNVLVTAARGVTGQAQSSWLWVSHDEGATFTAVPPVDGTQASNLPAGAEGHVDFGPDGTAYFIDLAHTAAVPVARSTDGGASWALRSATAAYQPGGDRPWVAAGPDDAVYVAWNQVPTGQWVYASTDGGRTFPVQTLLPGTHQAAGAVGGSGPSYAAVPDVGPDGVLYLGRSEPDGIAVYRSDDGARAFTRTLAWETDGAAGFIFTTVAVDDAGTVYVVTIEPVDGAARARYAYSTDGGASFSAPREVARAPGVHALSWSAAGPPGHLAVAFYENPDGAGTPDESAGAWFVRVAASTNADAPDAAFAEARVTPEPVHEGVVCTRGFACESGRDLADYLGVDVDPSGDVHVTWSRATRDHAFPGVWYARAPAPAP